MPAWVQIGRGWVASSPRPRRAGVNVRYVNQAINALTKLRNSMKSPAARTRGMSRIRKPR